MRSKLLIALGLLMSGLAHAADVTGKVDMIEIWSNGNVAITLAAAIPGCNGQLILNASSPSTKNIYAAVLAAKHADRSIRIVTNGCGAAEGYGGSYHLPLYVHPL
jgi:hypothetical protein